MSKHNFINSPKPFTMAIIAAFLMLVAGTVTAQIGGDRTPLLYSVHTYTVQMDNIDAKEAVWDIYPDSIDTEPEVAGATAFTKDLHYSVVAEQRDQIAGTSYIVIQFDKVGAGTLQVGKFYQLVYYEKSGTDCEAHRFYRFELREPFDVDISLDETANLCSDVSGEVFQTVPAAFITTLDYTIGLVTDYVNEDDETWSFNYNITCSPKNGIGTAATIDSVIFVVGGSPNAINVDPNATAYGGLLTQSATIKTITAQVIIHEVLGIEQNVKFELSGITGEHQEIDVDKVTGDLSTYVVNKMPGTGYIVALN